MRELESTVLRRHDAITEKAEVLSRIQALEEQLNELSQRKEQLKHRVDSQVRELERATETTKTRMAPLERSAHTKIDAVRRGMELAQEKANATRDELEAARHQLHVLDSRMHDSTAELARIDRQLAPLKTRWREAEKTAAQTREDLNAANDLDNALLEFQSVVHRVPEWVRSLPDTLASNANIARSLGRRFVKLARQTDIDANTRQKTFERIRHAIADSSQPAQIKAYCETLQNAYARIVDEMIDAHQKNNLNITEGFVLTAMLLTLSVLVGHVANFIRPHPIDLIDTSWRDYEHQMNAMREAFSQDPDLSALAHITHDIQTNLRAFVDLLLKERTKNQFLDLTSVAIQLKKNIFLMIFDRDELTSWKQRRHDKPHQEQVVEATYNFIDYLTSHLYSPPIQQKSIAHSLAASTQITLGLLGIGVALCFGYTLLHRVLGYPSYDSQLQQLRARLKRDVPKEVNKLLGCPPIKNFSSALRRHADALNHAGIGIKGFETAIKQTNADLATQSEQLAFHLKTAAYRLDRSLEHLEHQRQSIANDLNALTQDENHKRSEHARLNARHTAVLNTVNAARDRLTKETVNLDKHQRALALEQQRLEQEPRYMQWRQRLDDLRREIQSKHALRHRESEAIDQAHYPVLRELEALVARVGELNELIRTSNEELDARSHVVEQVYHDFVKPYVTQTAFERAVDRHVAVRDEELLNRVGLGVFVNGLGRTTQAASMRASSYYSMYHLLSASIEAAEQLAARPPTKSGRFYIRHDRPVGTTVSPHQHDATLPVSTTRVDFETSRRGERVITHIHPCADE
ncbi:MAG TPA: hypothetical protein VFS42_12505 [Burkholderiaceae bacterium]|nr:hypothetical protein [Burkholderiaceae bacterium]